MVFLVYPEKMDKMLKTLLKNPPQELSTVLLVPPDLQDRQEDQASEGCVVPKGLQDFLEMTEAPVPRENKGPLELQVVMVSQACPGRKAVMLTVQSPEKDLVETLALKGKKVLVVILDLLVLLENQAQLGPMALPASKDLQELMVKLDPKDLVVRLEMMPSIAHALTAMEVDIMADMVPELVELENQVVLEDQVDLVLGITETTAAAVAVRMATAAVAAMLADTNVFVSKH